MKILTKAFFAAVALSALWLSPGCSSDPNPVDYLNTKGSKANVRINFSVASSRASEDEIVSKVWLYVFDSNGTLELSTDALDASSGSVNIETTAGKKTIYGVSASQIVAPDLGSSLADFEASDFNSSVASLKTADGFVMTGKCADVFVEKSVSQVTSPNKFKMTLSRALAKVQVVYPNTALSSDYVAMGFKSFGEAQFKVMQSCTKMRIVPNGTDVIDMASAGHTDGTYAGYENTGTSEDLWVSAPIQSNNEKVQYVAENIVATPTAGNTSFVTLRMRPQVKYYTKYVPNSKFTSTGNDNYTYDTFYGIAFVDETTGYLDYAYNTENSIIALFSTKAEAQAYLDDVNAGKASVKLVSELDLSSQAPAMKKTTRAGGELKLMEFTNGYVYYRINIQDTEGDVKKCQVKRNTFYTLNVNSIKKLGAPSESYLIPTEPSTKLDYTIKSSGWLDTSFEVEPWATDSSDVNL